MINRFKLFLLRTYSKVMRGRIINYDESRYIGTFISDSPKLQISYEGKAEERIYIFWTGDNELTENRKNSLDVLRKKSGVEVVLITPQNLKQYIVPEFPLHPAYEYLSYVHRADYLRAYFMHYHGGGYCDIKAIKYSWKEAFMKLNRDKDKWILGYPEVAPSAIPFREGRLGKDLKKHYYRLIGNGAFIAKPESLITRDWIKQIHFVLDQKFDLLKINPGDARGKNKGYPLEWSEILGQIFQPILLKYNDRVLIDEVLSIKCTNYK